MRYPKALINLLMYRANSLGAHFLLWLVQSLRPNVSDSILHSLERVGAPPVLRMVPVGWRYSEVVKRRILLDQSISIRLPEIGPLAAEEYSWPNRYLWELHNVTLDVTSGYIFARNHVWILPQIGIAQRETRLLYRVRLVVFSQPRKANNMPVK